MTLSVSLAVVPWVVLLVVMLRASVAPGAEGLRPAPRAAWSAGVLLASLLALAVAGASCVVLMGPTGWYRTDVVLACLACAALGLLLNTSAVGWSWARRGAVRAYGWMLTLAAWPVTALLLLARLP